MVFWKMIRYGYPISSSSEAAPQIFYGFLISRFRMKLLVDFMSATNLDFQKGWAQREIRKVLKCLFRERKMRKGTNPERYTSVSINNFFEKWY